MQAERIICKAAISVSAGALNITEYNVYCHPTVLFIPSLLFYTCVWLTLIAWLSSQSLCRRPPLKTAQAWETFFFSHLNFYTSIYPPFNLAYNDAIRTKSIWKFCWERLMFHGFFLLMPLRLHWQQMLWKQQIHSRPGIITIMPMSRINVAACSGLSYLQWDCKTQRIYSRLYRCQWIPIFHAIYSQAQGVKCVSCPIQRQRAITLYEAKLW